MRQFISRVLDAERPAYLLGLLRVLLGLFLLIGSLGALREALENGYFADFFHIPLLPEWAVPSRNVYLGLLAGRCVGACLAMLGVGSRFGLLSAASIGLYLQCCDRLHYHNNRYVLELLAFLLAFTHCDRSFRLLGTNQAARGPYWAAWLMKVQISLVYATSALSKLVDADWRGGQVLHVRYVHVLDVAAARGHDLPSFVQSALGSPLLAEISSKSAIAGELFLAIGLWLPATRAYALWLGVFLHFGIQVAARVEIFSYLMGASYLLFAVPELRERKLEFDPQVPGDARRARWVARLDWLARFELVARSGAAWSAIDRDGRARHGLDAWVLLARALPLAFPLWLPLSAVAKVKGRRPAPSDA